MGITVAVGNPPYQDEGGSGGTNDVLGNGNQGKRRNGVACSCSDLARCPCIL